VAIRIMTTDIIMVTTTMTMTIIITTTDIYWR